MARELRERGAGEPPPDLLGYLDLVALATVCDVVPLTGVNRAFVVKGLLAIRQQQNAGLAALARVSRIGEPVNIFHLSFLIGPRINAGGRIGDAALGSRLLATDDPVEAGKIAETLDRLNQERQAMEQEMLARGARRGRSRACRRRRPGDRRHGQRQMASGHRRPARLAAEGSCQAAGLRHRLQPQRHRHRLGPLGLRASTSAGWCAMAAAEGLIVKGGGHAHGGRHHRRAVQARRAARLLRGAGGVRGVPAARRGKPGDRRGACRPKARRSALVDALEAAGPYGAGHPQPVLALPRHRLVDARLVGTGHIRVDLQSASGGRIQAIAFRAVDTALGDFLFKNRGATIHVAGSLSANYWNGNRTRAVSHESMRRGGRRCT